MLGTLTQGRALKRTLELDVAVDDAGCMQISDARLELPPDALDPAAADALPPCRVLDDDKELAAANERKDDAVMGWRREGRQVRDDGRMRQPLQIAQEDLRQRMRQTSTKAEREDAPSGSRPLSRNW